MSFNKLICKLGAIVMFAFPLVANSTVITIDNGDAGFSSSGLRLSVANCCVGSAVGDYYMVDQEGSQGDFAIWDPTGSVDWTAGIWKVEMNWTAYWNRSSASVVSINAGSSSLFVNQRYNGGKWMDLGTYLFSQNSASVKIDDSYSSAKSYFVADAVRFTLIAPIAQVQLPIKVSEPTSLTIYAAILFAMVRLRKRK